jgi:hypothetical protein
VFGDTNDPDSIDTVALIGWFQVLKGYIPKRVNIVEPRCVVQVKLLPYQCLLFICDDVVVCFLDLVLSKYREQNIKQTEDFLD